MTDRSARKPASPLVVALRLALEEAMETRRQREIERARQRGRLHVVAGRRTDAA